MLCSINLQIFPKVNVRVIKLKKYLLQNYKTG